MEYLSRVQSMRNCESLKAACICMRTDETHHRPHATQGGKNSMHPCITGAAFIWLFLPYPWWAGAGGNRRTNGRLTAAQTFSSRSHQAVATVCWIQCRFISDRVFNWRRLNYSDAYHYSCSNFMTRLSTRPRGWSFPGSVGEMKCHLNIVGMVKSIWMTELNPLLVFKWPFPTLVNLKLLDVEHVKLLRRLI